MSLAGNIWGDHPPLDGPYDWWACEEPERPADDQCAWWHECGACRLALAMAARTVPGAHAEVRDDIDGGFHFPPGTYSLMAVAVAMATQYADERMLVVLDGTAR